MNRFFCLILSLFLILCLSPVLILVAILVRLKLGTPIFFRQVRPGLNGAPFSLIKFRTMKNEVNQAGELLPDIERLTHFGRFLRKASIDELPQLINVLKGEMSFVGPRPLLMEYIPLYNSEQSKRQNVKPGITGWAQVNGRNAISWDDKFKLDVWYVENQSFWLDMKILWLTVRRVLQGSGVNQGSKVTMDKFKGNKS